MPFALVQQVEAHLAAISTAKQSMHEVLELASETNNLRKLLRAAGDTAVDAEFEAAKRACEKSYEESAGAIYGYLHTPVIAAVALWLADTVVGPLRWTHTAIIAGGIVAFAAVSHRRLLNPEVIVLVVSLMPVALSGSLTRIAASYFCVYTICPPVIMYAWQDISDRLEVRWFLIGLLMDALYLGTAALLNCIQLDGIWALLLATVVSLAEIGLLRLVMRALLDNGPWDLWFKYRRVGDTGRVLPHPLNRVTVATIQFLAEAVLIPLNRVARFPVAWATYFSRLPSRAPSSAEERVAPYTYEPLEGNTQIRLLKIRRGRRSDTVECEFVPYQLGSKSELYEAVSYVWGSPERTSRILVHDRALYITQSAFDIIVRRRSAWQDNLIWLDQVCINQGNQNNQGDNAEKSIQVQLMGRVYKEAAGVVAYLGDAPDAHHVQSLFSELQFLMHGLGIPPVVMRLLYGWGYRRKAVSRFFSNAWFRRVWIIQEAAFAQQLHIIYGNACIDWKYLVRAMDAMGHQEIMYAMAPPSRDEAVAYALGLRNVDPIFELRGDIRLKRPKDLATILKACHGFKSTDPRDKVYALLGLATDGEKCGIVPDYGGDRPARDVYVEAMLYILSTSKNPLNMLLSAGIGFERNIADLPSWVPDWSYDAQLQVVDSYYTAGSAYKPVIKVVSREPARTAISVDGVAIDRVDYVGPPNVRAGEDKDNYKLLQWFAAAEKAAADHCVPDLYRIKKPPTQEQEKEQDQKGEGGEEDGFAEAFTRTLLGNHDSHDKRDILTPERCRDYNLAIKRLHLGLMTRSLITANNTSPTVAGQIAEAYAAEVFGDKQPASSDESWSSLASRFLHFADGAASKRSFCVTAKKRMALVPPRTLVGDVVCLFRGARVPYVLRQVGGEYELIGFCYVHGVGDGEMASELEKSEPLVLV